MKAEQRRELKTNVLADRLNRTWQDLRHGSNTTLIVIGVLIIAGIGIAATWIYFSRTGANAQAAEWLKLPAATTKEQLDEIISANQGNPAVSRVARFEKARLLLREGLDQLLSGDEKARNTAVGQVKEAGELYEKLADETSDWPLLQQEALLGAAKARQTQGDLDGALTYYKKLADARPGSFLTKQGDEQAKALGDPATREKVDAFRKQLEADLALTKPR